MRISDWSSDVCSSDLVCLVFEGRTWTYSELARDVEHTADWLVENGIRTGERVGVFSTNHSSTVMLFLALARIGGFMVPVYPEFGVPAVSYVLNQDRQSTRLHFSQQFASCIRAFARKQKKNNNHNNE